ncbi:Piwi domain-containing protein [Phascolomyces articulosus]|uniref:Piwi domain-containing protein n=1 Tax=Phascolomyces articulosus TaxID=60185 RepID=A0AAD5JYP8_9FUNG|nr:Piwi domain-containing protein [Phascolomyces articulosus]
MSLTLTDYPLRPSTGTVGKKIQIRSNFFEVQSFMNGNVYHYDVSIGDDKAPPALRRKIWKAFEDNEGQALLNGVNSVYDGRKNVYAFQVLKPLGTDTNTRKEFRVELQGKDYKVSIKYAAQINMQELQNFLNKKSALTPNILTAVMAMDIMIRQMPAMTYPANLGRSFYTPQEKRSLPHGVEVWQGFYQSARPGVGKMFINVDVSATCFYESGPLPEVVARFLGRNSLDDLRRGITDRDRNKLEKFLRNVEVETSHRGEKKRKYKIHKLTPSTPDKTKFKTDDGRELTITQYFQQQYNLRLKYPFLPCVATRKDQYFPMEILFVVPGQRYIKKLDDKQTADMIKFTCQKPHIRSNKIQQGFTLMKYKENPLLQKFGMKIKPEMQMINARVLPAPAISYHNSSKQGTFTPHGGAWNLRDKKVAHGATLKSWSIVNFAHNLPKPVIERFIRQMSETFIATGMNVVNRNPPIMNANPQGNIQQSIYDAYMAAGRAAKVDPQLILCILPSKTVALYAEIKRISDTVMGLPTQCVQSSHVNQAKPQYCANVCLKVNVKLGGFNVQMSPQQIPFVSERPTIIFGADVTHPSAGDMNKPSIAAVTASMDPRAARYACRTRVQPNRMEQIQDLAGMVKELLITFYRAAGQKPERILFYRDGVSEGQFAMVLNEEVSQIQRACASLDKEYKPKITFVVVQKRHHARFFPVKPADADKSQNCPPGTVVDTDIVHPFEFDFYLQSHAGLQGTSRPTHYHVLYDQNKFTPDSLQELTYRLCYIYNRATRAVSLVPAVYYAHLLAFRARFHRKGEDWSDSLGTSESLDTEQQLASYAPVKASLNSVMYYM